MKVVISILLFLPFLMQAQGNDNIGISRRPYWDRYVTSIHVDSFSVIDKVTQPPQFSINIDSAASKLPYPLMEMDNLIGGDTYAIFKVNSDGLIDSIALSKPISLGLNKAIRRFLKSLPPMVPARAMQTNSSTLCQLAFHFKVREEK
jgi:hypothetical protein